MAKKTISDVTIIPDVAGAAKNAIENAGPDDVICIAGSLYVVGEAKEAIEKGLIKSVKIRKSR
jgi:dihydrofolate synthase/folylpolyglutamate synthase